MKTDVLDKEDVRGVSRKTKESRINCCRAAQLAIYLGQKVPAELHDRAT